MTNMKPNILIHEDNLDALEMLFEENIDGVKLAYIDPPYCSNTKNEYYCDCFDEKDYETYIKELIRRVVPLMDKHSFWAIQTDSWHSFDIKTWIDQIIGKSNFKGQIIVGKNDHKRYKKISDKLISGYDCLLLYATDPMTRIPPIIEIQDKELDGEWSNFYTTTTNVENQYPLYGKQLKEGAWRKNEQWAIEAEKNYERLEQFINENNISIEMLEYGIHRFRDYNNLKNEELKFLKKENCTVKYYLPPSKEKHITDNWSDINIRGDNTDFEHEVNERLFERLLIWLTKENDIILDPFLGSGASIIVASKLKRKWIGIEKEEYCKTMVLERIKEIEKEINFYEK